MQTHSELKKRYETRNVLAKDRMQKSMQVLVPKSKRLSQVGKVRVSLASLSRDTRSP